MKFITTAPDRRTLVKAIAEHTGMEPSYIGLPTRWARLPLTAKAMLTCRTNRLPI